MSAAQRAGQPPWRRIVESFLTLLAGEGAARAVGIVTVFLLARALGPTGFGLIVFGVALMGWYQLVADNGTQVATTSRIARSPEAFRQIAEQVTGLRLAAATVFSVLVVVGAQLFARSPLSADIYSILALMAPAAALNLRWMVLGVHAARGLAIANVVSQLVLLAGVALVVHGEENVLRVPLLYAGAELAFALVVLGLLVPRFGLIRPRVDLRAWRRTLHDGAPLVVSAGARGAMFSFDLLVIALAIGPEAAGFYGAALKPVQFAGTAIGLFSFSFLATYSTEPDERARMLLGRALRWSLIASSFFAVALAIGSSLLVKVVFGSAFSPAATVMAILALRIPFVALNGVYTSALVAVGRQAVAMRASIAASLVNVVGMLVVVPLFGIDEAALVSCAAAAAMLVVIRAGFHRVAHEPPAPTSAPATVEP